MKKLLLLILTVSAFVTITNAQKTWVAGGGSGSGNWSTAANWSGGTVPTATDSVVISSALTNGGAVITIDANAVCGALYLIGGGTATGPLLQFPATGSVSLTVNGGISITGGSGTAPNTRPKFTSNGNNSATLILNGYNGVVYTTSSSNTVANNSTGFNMNEGNVQIVGTGTATISLSAGARLGNLQIGDGTNSKVVNFIQTTTSTLTVTGLTVKSGATFNIGNTANSIAANIGSNNVSGVSNWVNGLVVETGASLIAQAATSPASYSTFNIFGGDIINNGTISLSNTNRFINVNIANNNTTARSRTIGGTAPITFRGLLLNDTNATITVSTPITVNDTVVFNNGRLVNTSPITLGASVTVAGGNTNSFVSGALRHTWAAATATKLYPLGKGTTYRPLSISLTTPTSPVISAEVFNTNPAGSFSGGALSQTFYYQTSLVSGTATSGGSVVMNFIPATDGVQNTTTLGVGQATTANGSYTNIGNTANTATSVTSNATYNPASGNFLALVSTANNTLPVVFKSVLASREEGFSIVKWTTTSEKNNKGFEVQRSVNGSKFVAIGFVKGAGNSNVANNYSFVDTDKNVGSVCYRLKQVDFDGKSTYSKNACVTVETEKATNTAVVTPNPFRGSLTVNYSSQATSSVTIQLIDLLGKVHAQTTELVQGGENLVNINTESLPEGVYFARIDNGTTVQTLRVIKK